MAGRVPTKNATCSLEFTGHIVTLGVGNIPPLVTGEQLWTMIISKPTRQSHPEAVSSRP